VGTEPAAGSLEVAQHPRSEAGTAPVCGDPHPLDLPDAVTEALHAATGDRDAVARHDHEHAGTRGRLGVRRLAGIEPAREAGVELGEVLAGRLDGRRVGGLDLAQAHGGRSDQQVGGGQRLGEPGALPVGEWRHELASQGLGALVERAPRLPSLAGQSHDAAAPVDRVGGDRHQSVVLQPSQEAGEVSRVEVEPLAQLAHVRALDAHLEEEARDRERPAEAEEGLVQDADALGPGAVEAAEDDGTGVSSHSLTLVRDQRLRHCGLRR
jgi:hypothetical protein